MSTLEAPDADRYQLFNEYHAENFRQTNSYLGMTHSEQLLMVESTALDSRGWSADACGWRTLDVLGHGGLQLEH